MKLILKLKNKSDIYVAKNKMKFCRSIVNKLTTAATIVVLHVRKTPAKGYKKISVDSSASSFNMWRWKIEGVESNGSPAVFLGNEIDLYLQKTFAKSSSPTEGVLYFKFSKK